MLDAVKIYREAFRKGVMPDPDLSVSEYADQFRVLPKSSVEPGKWRTSRTPYLKEIMDCLSPSSDVTQVKVIKGTQLGFTEAGNNWISYTIDMSPCPMMMVLPTGDGAKDHSKQKLTPTIKSMPSLREKVLEVKSRETGSTTTYKEFLGGFLVMTGANSGAAFRHKSIKNLFCDDIDGFPLDVDGEGDPLGLAENRTDAYGKRKKIYKVSSPTIKGASRIEQEYEDSDQREYYVPCPHCKEMQTLKWTGIKFDYDKKDYSLKGDVEYVCDGCGVLIEEFHKTWMLESGQWRAHNPGHEHRGYKLSSLYSPLGWLSWAEIVKTFLKAKKTNDISLWKRFTNTRLAETWEEEGEVVEGDVLYERREDYEGVPMGVGVLVAGADVQKNRIEIEVVGYGREKESWSIEVRILYGDTTQKTVWDAFRKFLVEKTYRHEGGTDMHIISTCVDSGYNTQEVYDFVYSMAGKRVYAIKGQAGEGKAIAGRASKQGTKKVPVYPVGVDTAKELIYARLKMQEFGGGYMHYPDYDEEHFKQLTGEKIVTKYKNGFAYREWVKIRARNEALDIRVYAMAALDKLNPNLDELVDALQEDVKEEEVPQKRNEWMEESRRGWMG